MNTLYKNKSENYDNLELSVKQLIDSLSSTENINTIEDDIYYNTAKNFGTRLNIKTYDELIEKVSQLGIGQVTIRMILDEKIVIQLDECFTCSDLDYLGKAVCYFEAGILAGAISTIVNKDMDAIETRCNALGDSFCEFEITEKKENSKNKNFHNIEHNKDISLLNLTLHSLNLVKNYKKIENESKRFHCTNQKLNKALRNVEKINEFNQIILDSIPNCLAVIDRNGTIIKINNRYKKLCFKNNVEVGNINIKDVDWKTRYEEVLKTGEPAIWHEIIDGVEYLIFESPIDDGHGVLRQLIPVESDFIKLLLQKINFLEKENRYYKNKVMEKEKDKIDNVIVYSEKMKEAVRYIKKVSKTDATVLLRGESGTGKSVFARKIHEESLRKDYPFVYIDCTTIPKNFFEAELFGYEPGAFTGARKNGKKGKLEAAEGGTIFLDEIAEIPIETQSKLLRFLQERKFEKIAGVKTHTVDVRVIAATNQNLEEMVRLGNFRKDLYYRLNVINITLPPLRERWEDIPHLINKYILDFSRETGTEVKEVSEEGMKILINYDWPGNVRELENVVKRLVIFSEGKVITKEEILSELNSTYDMEKDTSYHLNNSENNERNLIINLLKKYDYNKTRVSKELGITRPTLYNKMKKYNIDY
ncbi:sigma 54-interacting transcriptional regulator [Thermohalobacter berrensis]|uniref:Fis family transcriptional regulator n=1 Tax=Thermohalobacter berrensis TaxID=99594 RepID=A0A419T0E3_9FIRM|nr:sigma 54-interacting transcriptional regulator [Thermohalobacter berrensis]RKD30932.1 Fis family transcriptional regulator [Thermohalobacter berrensis]